MSGEWYRAVQIATGLAILGWSLWLKRRGVEQRRLVTLTLSGGASWLLLLGPAAEHPTFAFLAPFLAWALAQRDRERGRRLIEAAGVCVLVLGWGSLTRPLWGVAPWLILALPVGTTLFLAWLIARGATPREGIPFAGRANVATMRNRRTIDRPSHRETAPCRLVSSSCPLPSGQAISAPPRPSSSPYARPIPKPRSSTSMS
jgi:hypothetical protein